LGQKLATDLLVIEDLGLGFAEQSGTFREAISRIGKKTNILLKLGVRLDGSGTLRHLSEGSFRNRLHVVASANALRRRNASISRALSWDRTLEDIEHEFKSGPSSRDLACCATVVVHFGLAGAAVFHHGKLHRFYFLPDEFEGDWERDRPGEYFGIRSILTACLARHLICLGDYPVFLAVTQALAAQREAHHTGAGSDNILDIDLTYGVRDKPADPAKNPATACIAPPQKTEDEQQVKPKHITCVEPFRAAWNPSEIAVWPPARAAGLKRNRLLCNVTGTSCDSLRARAVDIVVRGVDEALNSVPKARYEKYVTADRDEIESINEIRRLILEYKSNGEDKRPLSIAVFGAPGSGKSFAIKQVAKSLFGKDKEPLEFNLSQFKDEQHLYRAFHQVRDASVRNDIPLVFWDEFDTAGLKWLADFLAPMQDAEFFDGNHKHPFGKCIFVFAGGTCDSFEKFERQGQTESGRSSRRMSQHSRQPTFQDLKGLDFISRLRGFLNVKGPNPTTSGARLSPTGRADPAYVLRRAIILRLEIERCYPHLIHPVSKRVAIAPNVLHAFLAVKRYEHGARSITALLGMSTLATAHVFAVSDLPSDDLLQLHVSKDFRACLAESVWPQDLLVALAKAGHTGYCNERLKTEPNAPDAKPYEKLTDDERRRALDPVPRRLIELQRLGFEIIPRSSEPCRDLSAREVEALTEQMAEPEHRIWLSDRLTYGFEQAESTQRWLRLNTDITAFRKISSPNRDINIAICRETILAFEPAGFCLFRRKPTSNKHT
jgi:hypothetical protein